MHTIHVTEHSGIYLPKWSMAIPQVLCEQTESAWEFSPPPAPKSYLQQGWQSCTGGGWIPGTSAFAYVAVYKLALDMHIYYAHLLCHVTSCLFNTINTQLWLELGLFAFGKRSHEKPAAAKAFLGRTCVCFIGNYSRYTNTMLNPRLIFLLINPTSLPFSLFLSSFPSLIPSKV